MTALNIHKLLKVGILAATIAFAAPIQNGPKPLSAYYESSTIDFVPEVAASHASASLGPWSFGRRLSLDKPLDKRLNLYVVLPGKQYQNVAYPGYDHNLVVNTLAPEKPREYDIYWCFILDSRLTDDLRGEHDLLAAAQQSFVPSDLFDVEDIPAYDTLAEKTGTETLKDLMRFRHKDGSLPRVLILPAHLAVSATASSSTESDKPAAPAQQPVTSH